MLLSSELSVWEVAHRWAGRDPSAYRFRLPLSVRDYARILVDAIYHGELPSSTLQMDKWKAEDGEDMKPYFIRHHLEDVWACTAGKAYDRSFLKWASIDRWDMKTWCDAHSIPLPEFWFPPGWGLEFDWTSAERKAEAPEDDTVDGTQDRLRASARTRIACQEIAKAIWREEPETTIAAMVRHESVRRLGGGAYFSDEALRGWLSAVAPPAVKAKRGRPRKKAPSSEDTTRS